MIDILITDLAVFARDGHRGPFPLIELAPGVTDGHVRAATEAHYEES